MLRGGNPAPRPPAGLLGLCSRLVGVCRPPTVLMTLIFLTPDMSERHLFTGAGRGGNKILPTNTSIISDDLM